MKGQLQGGWGSRARLSRTSIPASTSATSSPRCDDSLVLRPCPQRLSARLESCAKPACYSRRELTDSLTLSFTHPFAATISHRDISNQMSKLRTKNEQLGAENRRVTAENSALLARARALEETLLLTQVPTTLECAVWRSALPCSVPVYPS